MANLDLEHKINVPFAEKGNKINIPDTSQSGTVNMTDGFGSKYDTPIAEGGEYIYREEMNEILYKVYAAVKELQELAVTAGFPIDMTKALNVLDIPHGGTGGNNATEARSNLGLGSLATKSTITSGDIANNAVTNTKINDGAVTTSKIADTAVTANKLASSAVTNAKIAANAVSSDKIANAAVTDAKVSLSTLFLKCIEFTKTSNHGGYIDFHFNGATDDYTARIIEDAKGLLSVYCSGGMRLQSNYIQTFSSVGNSKNGIPPSGTYPNFAVSLASSTGTQKLPDGGTWFYYYLVQYAPNKDLHNDSYVGIAAGGTEVGVGGNTYRMNGFAFRIK